MAELSEEIHGVMRMKQSQLVDRNLELSEALLLQLLEDPSALEGIPEGGNLIVLPLDDPDLFKANLEQFVTLKEQGIKKLLVVVMESTAALEPRMVVRV